MAWYEIYIDNRDGNGLNCIYRAGDSDLVLENVHFKPVIGSAGNLEFQIAQNHPYYNDIYPLTTDIWLYRDGNAIFRGRYVGSQEDYQRTGTVTVEGALNFFVDSIQDPFEYEGNVQNFLSGLIENHNGMVEDRKKFTLGTVGNFAELYYVFEDYLSTGEILSQLCDDCGGFFRVRHENGENILDYVLDYGGTNNQPIRFGENLIDISKTIDASTIITCLIPVGAEIEVQTQQGIEKQRVDITSVNGGVKYITSPQGVAKWGQIWGKQEFPNATTPNLLMTQARAYLNEQFALPASITINAVDLSLLDVNFDEFHIGYWTTIESAPHQLNASYLLTEMDIDITQPEASVFSLGGIVNTITGTTAKSLTSISRAVKELAISTSNEINDKVNNATQLITGGLGGYVVMHRDADGHPDELLIMNTDSIDTARNVIRLNKNGIGFSTTGYYGTYKNAWTIDGNLIADFITTGSMLADRIRGGTLEVGGSGLGKNGQILVKDASNNTKALINKDGVNVYGGTIQGGLIQGSEIRGANIRGSVQMSCGDTFFISAADSFDDYTIDLGGFSFANDLGVSGDSFGSMNGKNAFLVTRAGDMYVKEIHPQSSWWAGWTLTEVCEDLWDEVFN